ncbi:MAG: DUF465 domain-containing protein [Deltaproteobacteria bacterium]|nr:DUF465 domain-containing protein [Candidatus Zymogenaceae bacterium]
MSRTEEEMKRKLMEEDPEFRALAEEHESFERILEEFNRKPYLTPAEEIERKNIQKQKLKGKDKMERILKKHR